MIRLPGRRIAAALANLAAFAVLAAVAAYWGWRVLAPDVELPASRRGDDFVTPLAAHAPFGVSVDTPPSGAPPAAATGDPRLLGVLAEPGGRGRALFRMGDGSARLASVGDALGGGATLAAVHADRVTLRDGGGERDVPLRMPAQTPASVAPRPPQARGAVAACVPAGYKGPVVRLNAELVSGLIAQPESLVAVAQASDGALVVRDEAGFAALLGLKKGDRVAQANGIALRAPEDVIVAILRPLAASQAVRVLGTRGSQPHELLIVNASACPG